VDVYHDVLAVVLQPGQTLTLTRLNHGFRPPFQSAEIHLTKAHRLVPLSALEGPRSGRGSPFTPRGASVLR
jgi:hypothetical protein